MKPVTDKKTFTMLLGIRIVGGTSLSEGNVDVVTHDQSQCSH